jgi:hypothetical protein
MKAILLLACLTSGTMALAKTSRCSKDQKDAAVFLSRKAFDLVMPLLSGDPAGKGSPNVFFEYETNSCDVNRAVVVCAGDRFTVKIKCGAKHEIQVNGVAAEEDGYIRSIQVKR